MAVEFGKKFDVIGFDINQERVDQLKKGKDITLEVDEKEGAVKAKPVKAEKKETPVKDEKPIAKKEETTEVKEKPKFTQSRKDAVKPAKQPGLKRLFRRKAI